MTNIMAVITDFFAGLEPRERLIIKVGAAILAMTMVVLLLLPRWESYSELKGQRDILQSDMAWLQENRDLVAGLANNCPQLRQISGDLEAQLTQLARRNQLEILSTTEKETFLSVVASGSKSNHFLKLMHQIACHGHMLGQVSFDVEEDDLSKIKATFEVERVN